MSSSIDDTVLDEMLADRLVDIGTASKLLGLATNTLRAYDRSGKLPAVRSGKGERRRYRLSDIKRLQNIKPI